MTIGCLEIANEFHVVTDLRHYLLYYTFVQ